MNKVLLTGELSKTPWINKGNSCGFLSIKITDNDKTQYVSLKIFNKNVLDQVRGLETHVLMNIEGSVQTSKGQDGTYQTYIVANKINFDEKIENFTPAKPQYVAPTQPKSVNGFTDDEILGDGDWEI